MLAADYIVDVGPGAGIHGGHIVATGTAAEIMACPESLTGQYLSGKRKIPVPETRRKGSGKQLIVRGAAENNLKNIDVAFPLGIFVCVTGVSGSGKSSLINEIVYKKLGAELNRIKVRPGKHTGIEGMGVSGQGDQHRSVLPSGERLDPILPLIPDFSAKYGTCLPSTQDAKTRGYGPGPVFIQCAGRPL